MRKYEILLEGSAKHPGERVELLAHDPSIAFSWGERYAHGRKFEVIEDGRSLGNAALASGGNFWILSPSSEHAAIAAVPPARHSGLRR